MEVLQSVLAGWGWQVPGWALGLGIAVAGWLAALLARLAVSKVFLWIRFDALGEKVGLVSFLRKGQVSFKPSQLVGVAAFWVVMLATLLQVSVLLDITVVTSLSNRLGSFAPGLLAAVLIAAIGWAVVSFVSNFTLTLARNAAWSHAALLAKSVKAVGVILVIAVAADQIDLRLSIFNALVLIITGGAALGLALAFGLGCQDLARDAMKRFLRRLSESNSPHKGPDLEG